jgi:hypothetical protein
MAIDQHAVNLVDTTVNAFNGSAVSVSPIDGISLIDSWLSALHSNEQNTDSIATGLNDLRTELRSSSPDGPHIRQLLTDLAQQAKQAADTSDSVLQSKLQPLVDSLEGFSKRLSGSGEQPEAGSQAPMTSTVGGESTNSGTGLSALGNNAADQSRMTGGTTSNGPAASVGMDDTTGSDGGNEDTTSTDAEPENTEEGAYRSGDADDTKDEENQSADTDDARRTESRSVGGLGVSGGTGDSATAQSQGRSQY